MTRSSVDYFISNIEPGQKADYLSPVAIERGMTKNFTATSLKPNAMDYRMRLRWNR